MEHGWDRPQDSAHSRSYNCQKRGQTSWRPYFSWTRNVSDLSLCCQRFGECDPTYVYISSVPLFQSLCLRRADWLHRRWKSIGMDATRRVPHFSKAFSALYQSHFQLQSFAANWQPQQPYRSVAAVDFCKQNGIILLSFPSHCSHKLQSLERSVYGPLKKCYNTACNSWMKLSPGKKWAFMIYLQWLQQLFHLPQLQTTFNLVLNAQEVGLSTLMFLKNMNMPHRKSRPHKLQLMKNCPRKHMPRRRTLPHRNS